MKCGFFIRSAVLVCLTGCGNTEAESRVLPDAAHDLGGTTFDFVAVSDKRFRIPGPDEKGNLVGKGKWNRRVDLHVRPKDLPGYSEIKKNLAKAFSCRSARRARRFSRYVLPQAPLSCPLK